MDRQALAHLIRFYDIEAGNAAGGNLHIVTDDYNVGDGSVQFCLAEALAVEDYLGAAIAKAFLTFPEEERESIAREAMKLRRGF